ncbi:hypothetical protein VE25_14910 [Devosia geojensis]|uniref:Uncharacterized protein n=1 Tax=Devosia geojensis TaxID=443610 RepID=A0A0F5FSE0_9HYPH|nr:hypothetical protein [Devosia geojensis]KKB11067.1 hypothetical protein VE25_14910 [Devosia geojensis]
MMMVANAPTLAGPPPTDDLGDKAASGLLRRLVTANVASSNCAGYEVSNAQWKFVVDTADQVANQLGLDSAGYDERYYGPAFDALDDDPQFCETQGPLVAPLIEEMVARGGTIDKYKAGG